MDGARNRAAMRPSSLGADESGLSEIVGALLLVLVVTAAGATFGTLYLENQKESQQRERLATDRLAEELEVQDVVPTASGSDWSSLAFTFVNPTNLKVTVVGWTVAGVPVETFELANPDGTPHGATGTQEDYTPWTPLDPMSPTPSGPLEVASYERLVVTIAIGDASFYGDAPDLPTAEPVKFAIETARLNSFSKVFVPPTALAQYQETITTDVILLDGTLSSQPTEGNRIVAWTWTFAARAAPGTIAVTSGSTAVVGTGTTFSPADVGRTITDSTTPGNILAGTTIAAFIDATHVTLSQNAAGTGGADAYAFAPCPTAGTTLRGSVVRAALTSGSECDITLTVRDAMGVTASDALWYAAP